MDEKSAIELMRRGDISGLEALVQQYERKAIRASFLISHDLALSEDVVQTAFLRAYERIHQFDSQRSFEPWFFRSVINDTLRAIQRRGYSSADTATLEEIEAFASGEDDLFRELEAAETKEAILSTLSLLSPVQRTAIVLRYYLDLSESEMAQALDCPPGTIKRRLYDARQSLRRLLPSWVRPAGD